MIVLQTGTEGLGTLAFVLLLWGAMPLTAIIALGLAWRGLRSRLDWGWISVAGLVLAAPYVAAVGLFGPDGARLFLLALGVKGGIALVVLLNPVVAVLIVMVALARLTNRPPPVPVTRTVQPATRLTVDPRRARTAAVGLALAAGLLLALPAGQIDRRAAMALLLFLIPIAAVTAVVRRPIDRPGE